MTLSVTEVRIPWN